MIWRSRQGCNQIPPHIVTAQHLDTRDGAIHDVEDDHAALWLKNDVLVTRTIAAFRLRPRIESCTEVIAVAAPIHDLERGHLRAR